MNTVLNVVLRTAFAIQVPGSLNFTILYLLPILVFLGLGLVQAKNAHISATLVVDRFGEFGQRVFKIFNSALILVCATVMAVGATNELLLSWGQSLGGVGALPIGPSWIFVPLGLAMVALRALWQLLVLVLVPGDHGTRLDPEAPGAKESLTDA
ncbi:TRAP transporter small permease [Nocardiopsis synnemataformans]|uniref:TRAP transporter small permease n=1 Tax=Nocardiopsis synnemataformans TaxID=61305 RepID=UPI003EB95005